MEKKEYLKNKFFTSLTNLPARIPHVSRFLSVLFCAMLRNLGMVSEGTKRFLRPNLLVLVVDPGLSRWAGLFERSILVDLSTTGGVLWDRKCDKSCVKTLNRSKPSNCYNLEIST